MDIQTKNRIITQLDQISYYVHRVVDLEGQVSAIERDILLKQIRALYDQILKIDLTAYAEEEGKSVQEETPVAPSEKESEKQNNSEGLEELKKNIEALKKQFENIDNQEKDKPEPAKNESPKKSPQEPPDSEKDSKQKNSQENKKQKPPQDAANSSKPSAGKQPPKTIADQNGKSSKSLGETFNTRDSSLNDYLSIHKSSSTIGDKMKQHRIGDLKAAIDINHKFLFINDLFGGNTQDYNATIEMLNNCSSLEEAIEVLKEKREQYKWDQKEGTFRIFNDLIHRKFQ